MITTLLMRARYHSILCIPLPMQLLQVHINVEKSPESIVNCLYATPDFTCATVQFGNTLLLVM